MVWSPGVMRGTSARVTSPEPGGPGEAPGYIVVWDGLSICVARSHETCARVRRHASSGAPSGLTRPWFLRVVDRSEWVRHGRPRDHSNDWGRVISDRGQGHDQQRAAGDDAGHGGPEAQSESYLRFEKDGYCSDSFALTSTTSGWVWGNVLLGGLVGSVVDFASGGARKLSSDSVHVSLKPCPDPQQAEEPSA